MESSKPSTVTYEMDSITLTTLNDDCKSHIFSYLSCSDLISLADASKLFYAAACDVFRRKYKKKKIDFGVHRLSLKQRIVYPDILITRRIMTLRILRHFGHLMENLYVDFQIFTPCASYTALMEYLCKYASKSITHLSLQECPRDVGKQLERSFVNVRVLQIQECRFRDPIPIRNFCPNLQTLKLRNNYYAKPSVLGTIQLPMLKYLSLYDVGALKQRSSNDIIALLSPRLERLDLYLISNDERNSLILLFISDNLPHLKHLSFWSGFSQIHRNEMLVFDNIESLSMYVSRYFPFSFNNLKYLEHVDVDSDHQPFYDLINQNAHLKRIKITCWRRAPIARIHGFFELDNVLMNVEEIDIDTVKYISAECILNFFRRNRAVKKFSMKGTMSALYDLSQELVFYSNFELKIRNHALEFVIDGWGSPMKYVLRRVKWVYDSESVSMMELCTYEESLLTEPYENYHEHMNALREMMYRYHK